jgi:hypothetical protein
VNATRSSAWHVSSKNGYILRRHPRAWRFVAIVASSPPMTAPTPADVLALDHEELAELVHIGSRSENGAARTKQIRPSSRRANRTTRGGESANGPAVPAQDLWHIALGSLRREGDLRDCCLRRQREAAHHLAPVTAVAAMLCHAFWRVLTNRRDHSSRRTRQQTPEESSLVKKQLYEILPLHWP